MKKTSGRTSSSGGGTAATVGLLLGAVIALAAGFFAPLLASARTPLGVPLPSVPPPMFELLERDQANDTSWPERKVIAPWLRNLAPQPDGLPPLVTAYHNDLGDFTLMNPYGAQSVIFSSEEVLTDGVLAQTGMQFDLPVRAVKYSVPTRTEGESLSAFTERLKGELEGRGAEFFDADIEVEIEYYRFEQLQFKRESEEDGPAAHYLFIGPLASRVLVIDMMTTPERFDEARPLVTKMIRSFNPGNRLKMRAIEEFPELAPEGYTPSPKE